MHKSIIPLEDDARHLAEVTTASPETAAAVLALPEGDDTRSGFRWVRLWDGTLILGVFPHGDTYLHVQETEGV